MPSVTSEGGAGEAASAELGSRIALAGRYRLRAALGRGAYGEVWEADDLVLGERVAIKWLLHAGPEPSRVRSEIATLRLLRLPGVARLLDEGMEEGRPFFVMERVDGTPFPGRSGIHPSMATVRMSVHLSETVAGDVPETVGASATLAAPGPVRQALAPRLPRRSWLEIAPSTEALLEILARVHAASIVHRDLKPENVLVRADGRPVVLDFGIALGRASPAGAATDGQIAGTPAYMAPEQISGEGVEIDARADLYALGVMLYEALTGSLPHEASNIYSLMVLRTTTAPAPVRDRAPEVPPHVAALVDRLLAIAPEERPRSAAAALAALRGQSEGRGVGSALLGALGPGPIAEAALRELFVGPDRFFHLREDGARALWARSAGVPARVAAELDAWVRAGIARWDGDRIAIDRTTLDELGVGPPIAATLAPGGPADALDGSEDGRRRGRRTLAETMPQGEPGRLVHLVAAGEDALVAAEALALARRLAQEGRLGQATTALHEGLLAIRQGPLDLTASEEPRLLSLWVEVAFAERRPHALDRVLYEICRSVSRASPDVAHLEGLVRVALLVDSPSWRARARAQADALAAFDDPALERWRQWVRVRAGLRESPEAAEAAVAGTQVWAGRTAHPAARASVAGVLGLVRYEQGRFDEAARCHAEAAASEAWLPLQLAATLNEAGALLDALRPESALARARAAGEMAARCRHLYFEVRAAWIARTAAFRLGELQAPDRELVEASVQFSTALLAMVCFTEAAVAYRAGALEAAGELVDRALDASRRVERRWLVMFGRCLAAAVRGVSRDEAEELIQSACGCPITGLGIQALGLLRRGCPSLPPFPDDVLAPLCRDVPEDRWDARLDVLSVRESLAACRAVAI
ncbi:serine/threonine-protein kinase [Sorangium sp. So ce448]|uniref:protein kinase domain-containing protein n=1 Tax=Sorangium sp. So ce448 TaxID=3133314 RepID=UPI003F63104D